MRRPVPVVSHLPIAMTRTGNPNESPPSAFSEPFAGSFAGPEALVPRPPSSTLLADIAKMRPVRPRVPRRSLLIVALLALVYPVWTLTARPLRSDMEDLSVAWVVGVGALWLAGFILPLAYAILPGRDQVLPDGRRAVRAAGLAALVLTSASFLLGLVASGAGLANPPTSAEALGSWRACVSAGLQVSAPVIVAGALALRRVALTQAWRLGAGVGAAGGSLAGLMLHLTCSSGQPAHMALAHGGSVVLGAVAGALSLLLIERTSR